MSLNPNLKISLDYHGVIDTRQSYFAEFCSVARKRGHSIFITSGAPKAQISTYLHSINLEYDFIFSILDYCLALRQITQTTDGRIIIKDKNWNFAKAEFCKNNKVDIHIDDSIIYQQYFNNKYCRYKSSDCICILDNHYVIDFNQSPQDSLYDIEKVFNIPVSYHLQYQE